MHGGSQFLGILGDAHGLDEVDQALVVLGEAALLLQLISRGCVV